jgi:hypothetical protein
VVARTYMRILRLVGLFFLFAGMAAIPLGAQQNTQPTPWTGVVRTTSVKPFLERK